MIKSEFLWLWNLSTLRRLI
uniref:Uncharacterized protein n=1 Tax=Arundo donax TaxID=35708 RepID=A0A0A8ZRS4_ARUDO